MLNRRKIFDSFINIICIIVTFFLVLELNNSYESLKIIGIWITIFSVFILFRFRKRATINLLVGTIALINIFLVFSVCFHTYDTAYYWQIGLIETDANIINIKNYMLFTVILLIFIGSGTNKEKNEKNENFETYNSIIITICLILLVYILFFGYDRGNIGTYTLNTNAIYEYRNNNILICLEI